MTEEPGDDKRIGQILDTPHLADALESDRFKQFLDHIPLAVAVAELHPSETIVYVNLEFERLIGLPAAKVQGSDWSALPSDAVDDKGRPLKEAITTDDENIGVFTLAKDKAAVEAWSNVIQDDEGKATFRLVALARRDVSGEDQAERDQRLRDKDILLKELQHRVKNNLQMITALIRMESRNLPDAKIGERFDRLAGRVETLALLYRTLSDEGQDQDDSIDLGIYLSQVASAVMAVHAVEGIRLDLLVDTWSVSINVAMPTGLVVNELLTNALKYAFAGRDGGTITMHSIVDGSGCRVIVADDGVGLPEGEVWPQRGKIAALIVQSLKQNAKAEIAMTSEPGQGFRFEIFFARADAAPDAA